MTAQPPEMKARKIPELALHQLCELIPPCTAEEFQELKEDIRKNGLQVPIKLFENKILDGRSRYQACLDLEKVGHLVEFKPEPFTGTLKESLAYVISMNVKRRHLSASQRAMIAARLVTTTLGGDRSVILPTEINQEDAAKLSGVAVKMVTDAKKVLARSDLAEKVVKGEVSVATAANQIRKENPNKKVRKSQKTEAEVAAEVYKNLQEQLIDALRELAKASSFPHAKEKSEETKRRLDETIESMKKEEDEKVKKAA